MLPTAHSLFESFLLLAGGLVAIRAAIPRRQAFYQATPETIDLGRRLLQHYGSWEAVEQAARQEGDGVHRVTLPVGDATEVSGRDSAHTS